MRFVLYHKNFVISKLLFTLIILHCASVACDMCTKGYHGLPLNLFSLRSLLFCNSLLTAFTLYSFYVLLTNCRVSRYCYLFLKIFKKSPPFHLMHTWFFKLLTDPLALAIILQTFLSSIIELKNLIILWIWNDKLIIGMNGTGIMIGR